jgi:haloacetate dehalogenase
MRREEVGMPSFFPGFKRERVRVNGVELNVVHGGAGIPVLLLHGYPQMHLLWHKVAPHLAERYRVVAPDMRGYGDSEKPPAAPDGHAIYCKRTLAKDLLELMGHLGHSAWHVVGHDRGARVAHRMALDHPKQVKSFTSLDVVASQAAFDAMDAQLSYAWFHWHLMRQPYPLPETLIGNSVRQYFDFLLERWCATPGAIPPEVHAEYARCFCNTETVRSTCAEYRSVALDLEHDEVDRGRKLECPVLVLWGANTSKRPGWQTGKRLDILETWRERARDVRGRGLDCGHFVPDELVKELLAFWSAVQ